MRYALSENSGTSASRSLLSRVVVAAPSAALRDRANVRIRKAHDNESVLREEAERKAEESRQQLVRLNVSTGNRLLEEGDNFRALLWFTEALRLENGDKAREDVHRRRIASVLRQSPELAQVLFDDAAIFGAEFSPDGARVATTGFLPFVRIWDVTTGKITAPPIRPETNIASFKFTGDGRRIVTMDDSGRLEFWDVATGEMLSRVDVTNARADAGGLGFSPDDGQRVAVACSDGGRMFGALAVKFSPDGQRLVTTSEDQTARLWNLRTNGGVRHMLRLEQAVTGLQFSPDGQRVLTTSNDGAAQLWDAQTGELVGPAMKHAGDLIQAVSGAPVMQTPPQSGDVTHAEFSPDRRFLLTLISAGSDSPAALIWECATGEPVTPLLKYTASFSACAWNPNGREVAIAACDGAVLLWDVSPVEGPVEALRREAEILSAHRIVPGHGLIPLTAKEVRERWEAPKPPPSR